MRNVPFFLALVVGLAGSAVDAAKLPDWAEPFADATTATETSSGKELSRVLLNELHVTVAKDGTFTFRSRRAVLALSADAKDIGIGGIPFGESSRNKISRAWHLPPEGTAERYSKRTAVDIADPFPFRTDRMQRFVSVDGVKRGSLVFFEFESEEKLYTLGFTTGFGGDAPVDLSRVEVSLPEGWTARGDWLRFDGPAPVLEGAVYTWELRDLPMLEWEPLAEPPWARAPRLVVGIEPPEGADIRVPALGDWSRASTWIEELFLGRDEAGPAVEQAASRTMEHAGTAVTGKVWAASRYVRDQIRYVAKAVGIGGYQPHRAEETLSNLYGDCKDKGTLLRSVLKTQGILSYPVLVNSSEPETVSDDVPSLDAFDHLILAVSLPAGAVPDPAPPALLQTEEFGALLFVDSTNEYASVGWISAALAGKRALIVAGSKGHVLTLPGLDPAVHRVEIDVEVGLRPDGTIGLERTSRCYGEPAETLRAAYRRSSTDRRTELERSVAATWIGASFEDYDVVLENADGACVETISWNAPPGGSATARSIPLFPEARDFVPGTSLGRRKTPVVFTHPAALRQRAVVAGVGEGVPIPQPREWSGDGWSAATRYELRDGALHAECEVVLSRTRFKADAFRELKKLYAALATVSAEAVTLPE
jgi:hypothetical protein